MSKIKTEMNEIENNLKNQWNGKSNDLLLMNTTT